MKAYIIGNFNITDPEKYRDYQLKTFETLQQYGGTPLVVGHEEVFEGRARGQTIVLEFDSIEQAKTWYNSPEYQAIVKLRYQSTEGGFGVLANEFILPENL